MVGEVRHMLYGLRLKAWNLRVDREVRAWYKARGKGMSTLMSRESADTCPKPQTRVSVRRDCLAANFVADLGPFRV